MNFLHPDNLWALIALPAVLALFAWAAWRRREAMRRFGDVALLHSLLRGVRERGRVWKGALIIAAVGLLAVALAGPRYGTSVREVQREGVDLVVALDVSLSMLAEDVAPSRLARAKREIVSVAERLHGDRVGLVVFAGDAFLQCPLTTDYSALRLFLDVAGPSSLSTPGSNFVQALQMAMNAFQTPESEEDTAPRTRAVLLVSDGQNHVSGLDAVTEELREEGIHLFTVGVGETEGAPIPLMEDGRFMGYKENNQGDVVTTRLRDDTMKQIAGEGRYYRIGRTSSNMAQFVGALDALDRSVMNQESIIDYEERYQWPLALALILLLGEVFVRDRSRKT